MEKEAFTNFFGVLKRFIEVIKLQSFEFSVSDVIPTGVQKICNLFFLAFFVSFVEKKPYKGLQVLDHFKRTY